VDISSVCVYACYSQGKPAAAAGALGSSALDDLGGGALTQDDAVSVWVVPPNRWWEAK